MLAGILLEYRTAVLLKTHRPSANTLQPFCRTPTNKCVTQCVRVNCSCCVSFREFLCFVRLSAVHAKFPNGPLSVGLRWSRRKAFVSGCFPASIDVVLPLETESSGGRAVAWMSRTSRGLRLTTKALGHHMEVYQPLSCAIRPRIPIPYLPCRFPPRSMYFFTSGKAGSPIQSRTL